MEPGIRAALVRELDDAATYEIALVENIQRQDLNAIEEASAYRRLIEDFGHNQEALAKLVGKSRSHVANLMRLLTLPTEVQDMVRELEGCESRGTCQQIRDKYLKVSDANRERLAQCKAVVLASMRAPAFEVL